MKEPECFFINEYLTWEGVWILLPFHAHHSLLLCCFVEVSYFFTKFSSPFSGSHLYTVHVSGKYESRMFPCSILRDRIWNLTEDYNKPRISPHKFILHRQAGICPSEEGRWASVAQETPELMPLLEPDLPVFCSQKLAFLLSLERGQLHLLSSPWLYTSLVVHLWFLAARRSQRGIQCWLWSQQLLSSFWIIEFVYLCWLFH